MKRLITLAGACALLWSAALAQTHVAGMTYSSFQHQGACGRMIGVDAEGRIHLVWMNVLGPSGTQRHVYYNVWDPGFQDFYFPFGVQVNTSTRAGNASLAVQPDGFCFPAFHETRGMNTQSAAAIDFLPAMGAFTAFGPATLYENGQPVEILWPLIAQDAAGTLHMFAQEADDLDFTEPARLFRARGTPVFGDGFGESITWQQDEGGAQWRTHDQAVPGGCAVAASRSSERIVLARMLPDNWPDDSTGLNNDVLLQWSDDGGSGWSRILNLTDFSQPDYACHAASHNDICCSRDTLRAFNDLCVFIDAADTIHVAFTTITRYHWQNGVAGPYLRPNKAALWHWRSGPDGPHVIAHYAVPDSLLPANYGLGARHSILERPSLTQDPATGYLYCSFLKYDTAAISTEGYFNADVFVTVSMDGGSTWAVATNVTNSTPPVIPAPAGSNLSEQDATLAERVTDGILHLSYTLDRNGAGDGSGPMQNSVIYHRVPVSSIAAEPAVPYYPLHVESFECDTIDVSVSPAASPARVGSMIMYGAQPNPFNAATVIRFDIPQRQSVTLKVYDLLGQTVGTLHAGALEAGSHTVAWNAGHLPSGVYFVSLHGAHEALTQKVLLLK